MSTPRQTLATPKNLDGMLAGQFNETSPAEAAQAIARFGNGNVKPADQKQRRQWRRRRLKRFG